MKLHLAADKNVFVWKVPNGVRGIPKPVGHGQLVIIKHGDLAYLLRADPEKPLQVVYRFVNTRGTVQCSSDETWALQDRSHFSPFAVQLVHVPTLNTRVVFLPDDAMLHAVVTNHGDIVTIERGGSKWYRYVPLADKWCVTDVPGLDTAPAHAVSSHYWCLRAAVNVHLSARIAINNLMDIVLAYLPPVLVWNEYPLPHAPRHFHCTA